MIFTKLLDRLDHTYLATISWRTAWKSRKFRIAAFCSILSLLACASVAPHIFAFIQARPGIAITDPVLELLPATDLSLPVFFLIHSLILTSIVFLCWRPFLFLLGLQGYVLLTLLRFFTLLITPLDIPEGLIVLRDPFTDRFLYQQTVTKDLFFSGHTATIALFAFCVRHSLLRILLFTGASAIGIMVLIQHVHYTIDVIAAPGVAWLAFRMGLFISSRSGYRELPQGR